MFIDQQVNLAAQLGAVSRVLAGRVSDQWRRTRATVDTLPVSADPLLLGVELDQPAHQQYEHASFALRLEVVMQI